MYEHHTRAEIELFISVKFILFCDRNYSGSKSS